jgi:hypothetical protein
MHLILRGIDRCAIFFTDDDNRYFLYKLSELAKSANEPWLGLDQSSKHR